MGISKTKIIDRYLLCTIFYFIVVRFLHPPSNSFKKAKTKTPVHFL